MQCAFEVTGRLVPSGDLVGVYCKEPLIKMGSPIRLVDSLLSYKISIYEQIFSGIRAWGT